MWDEEHVRVKSFFEGNGTMCWSSGSLQKLHSETHGPGKDRMPSRGWLNLLEKILRKSEATSGTLEPSAKREWWCSKVSRGAKRAICSITSLMPTKGQVSGGSQEH